MKGLERKGEDFDRKRSRFINDTMKKIRSGTSDIKQFDKSESFFRDIVEAQRKKFTAESNKILAKEYGIRGSDFRREAEEMMAHANRLQKLEATVGKDRIEQTRKLSERIRNQDVKSYQEFQKNKADIFKAYKEDLANQRRYYDEKIKDKQRAIRRLGILSSDRSAEKKELRDLKNHRKEIEAEQRKLNAMGTGGADRFFSGGGRAGGGGGGRGDLILGGGKGGKICKEITENFCWLE